VFDMGGGFVPYRRDIAYLKEAREVPIREVASELEFITRRGHWGILARRGHFEITMADLHTIGRAMGAAVTARPAASASLPSRSRTSVIAAHAGHQSSKRPRRPRTA